MQNSTTRSRSNSKNSKLEDNSTSRRKSRSEKRNMRDDNSSSRSRSRSRNRTLEDNSTSKRKSRSQKRNLRSDTFRTRRLSRSRNRKVQKYNSCSRSRSRNKNQNMDKDNSCSEWSESKNISMDDYSSRRRDKCHVRSISETGARMPATNERGIGFRRNSPVGIGQDPSATKLKSRIDEQIRAGDDHSSKRGRLERPNQRAEEENTACIEGRSRDLPVQIHNYQDRRVYIKGNAACVSTGDYHSGDIIATTVQQHFTDKRQEEMAQHLKTWTEGMVETSAFKRIMEMLEKGTTWITIKGSPGEGKTTNAKMALRELQKSGRQVFQARSPGEFSQIRKTSSEPVVLLDDILGDLEFDLAAWLRWKDVFHEIFDLKEHTIHSLEAKMPENTEVTILFVGRHYVLESVRDHTGRLHDVIFQESHVVDMSHSVERSLDEKQRIWNAIVGPSGIRVPQQSVNNVFQIKGAHGFPHVCRLFVTIRKEGKSNITVEDFFNAPLTFLNQTVALFLENEFKLYLLKEMIASQGKVSERDLTRNYKVLKTAKQLLGTYLRIEGGYFVFDHPSIYESVAFNLCKYHTSFVVENCDLSFIHKRIRFVTSCATENDVDFVVYISQSFVTDLAERFAIELSNSRNLYLVLSHQACTQYMFVKDMMSKLTTPLTELVNMTFCRYYLHYSVSFLSLLASNKSPELLKYIDDHTDIQLTQRNINTVLYGVCKYAASDVLTYLMESCHTLDINVNYEDMETPLMIAVGTKDSQFVHDIMSINPNLKPRHRFQDTPLHCLCKHGLVSVVKQVLDRGIDINMKNWMGCSPLMYACWYNQEEVVQLLLDRGAQVDDWAVNIACRACNKDVVKMVVEKWNTTNKISEHDRLLSFACIRGDMEVISYLIDKGASVNVTFGCQPPFHVACSNNKPEAVRCLLDHGAVIDSRDDEAGYTALHRAVSQRSIGCVEVLLEFGIDVNVQNRDGNTPLHIASENGSKECVVMLLKRDADVNVSNMFGYTPLHNAAKNKSKECIDALIKAGACVNAQGRDAYTPLHLTAEKGSTECADVLVKAGSDVNIQGKDGNTSLHKAAGSNSKECVYVLLKAGSDVDVKCKYDYTPLFKAAECKSIECVYMLLKAGAGVNVQSKDGCTPLHKAAERASTECVNALLKYGADVHVQSEEGKTPLHTAVYCRSYLDVFLPDIHVCQALVKHGADVNRQDTYGNTPLHLLCRVDSDTTIVEHGEQSRVSASTYEDMYRNIVALLIDHESDVSIPNNRGELALRGWCKKLYEIKQGSNSLKSSQCKDAVREF